ncbi:hypothetical protein [Microbacterium sp. NIBRBAC000506063]|uniref:hypothetical protein n=1 Tax=Microbacterium sp. NIBRBAC000506063 TaxID=2734618 RepID=UPI001BB4A060|nr:hypothetical protein [Microbacterium sp. NIBRBAC000506063]QTV79164.1 hypothetical protein KAE78_08775 [Microbacterium sp. NIBRBAC000506063]
MLNSLTTKVPTISGTARVGQTLKAKTGTWTTGTKYKYQWYADGKAISGATKSSLKLPTSAGGRRSLSR